MTLGITSFLTFRASVKTMKITRLSTALVIAIGALTLFTADVTAFAQTRIEPTNGNPHEVTGFRSARFGMTISETRLAIQKDFQLSSNDINEQKQDSNRTTSLIVRVNDLFPDSGPAQVVYIHGYKEKKLIQVNILWGTPVVENPDAIELVSTANVLRNYFSNLNFKPDNLIVNTRVDDGTFIVFRATDNQERMVLLQLFSRIETENNEEGEAEPKTQVVSLWLSYIEDTKNPDVFQIEAGAF